jgi:hypothetical protein
MEFKRGDKVIDDNGYECEFLWYYNDNYCWIKHSLGIFYCATKILTKKENKQMNDNVLNHAKAIILLIENLNQEVRKAGGGAMNATALEKLTALDLISIIAPNGITFKYNDIK